MIWILFIYSEHKLNYKPIFNGKMTFRTTFLCQTPNCEGVRNELHDEKQDVREGWYETSSTLFNNPTEDFDKAIKLISTIRSNFTSLYGLRYRSVLCTIVRNDPHLLEYLVRNLISGFSHIVVYDNNRILAGYDMNITNLLAPFIAAGVVTHVPFYQNSTELLLSHVIKDKSAECVQKYGKYADWTAVFDTDEYFYYEKENASVHTINDLLVELEQKHICAARIPWSMMYGEAKVLKQKKTLFEAYTRKCKLHYLTKVLSRASHTQYEMPHHAACIIQNYTTQILISNNKSTIGLVHYYSKSIEEYLEKADKSTPPNIRVPLASYDQGPNCNLTKFAYSVDYKRMFLNTYNQLNALHSLKQNYLHPTPNLNIKTMPDYALYIHLKYRCANRQEFDNEKYLSMHADVKAAVEKGTLVDGLYHFMANFHTGVKGCWKTDTHSVCE
jgi:hypothetical protein